MKRAAIVGAVLGAVIGAVFWTAYAIASLFICAGDFLCPGSWIPSVVVSGAGFLVTIVLCALGAICLRKIYRLTRVE